MAKRNAAKSPKELGLHGVRGVLNLPYPFDEDGTPLCRWCHGSLPLRRSSWCSNECRAEYCLAGGHWTTVKGAVFSRDKGTCQQCGKRAPHVQIEVDHIIPVVKGGDDRLSNLRLLCTDCHKAETKALHAELRGSNG